MANVLINEDTMTDIADAIRSKKGVSTTYKPADMPSAIESISGGGVTPTGTINITTNGTHDVTNYASANVAVPQGSTPTGTKEISITSNGTTTEDVTNYASAQITVNVPSSGGDVDLYPLGTEHVLNKARVTITESNHVKIEFTSAISSAWMINLHRLFDANTQAHLNNPKWFTMPAGTCVFKIKNITNTAISMAMNFKIANSTTSTSNFGTGDVTGVTEFTKSVENSSAFDVGCLFVAYTSVSSGTVIEFDIELTCNGTRYI